MKLNSSYPLPKGVLKDFTRRVFTPLKRGQCVTTLWVAGGGKRFRINFLLKERKILKEIFGQDLGKTLFVNIHPDEILEFSNAGYLNLMREKLQEEMEAKSIPLFAPKTQNPLRILKEHLRYLLSLGKEVIFFLNDFEVLLSLPSNIFVNLESILAIDKKKIRSLFLSHLNLVNEELLFKMGNFKYALLRNVIYVPLFKGKEIDYLIAFNEKSYSFTLPQKTKKILKTYFGGHPLLLKYAIGKLARLNLKNLENQNFVIKNLTSSFELKVACKEIWKALNQEEKDIVSFAINSGYLPPNSEEKAKFLLKTGILRIDSKNRIFPFGEFFKLRVQKEIPVKNLTYNKERREIFLGPLPCSDKFTPQEHEVLCLLLEKEGHIVSRDQIAKTLWGENYYDKYSDWAIDKVISTIRRKLTKMGFPSRKILTFKKRGFKLSP